MTIDVLTNDVCSSILTTDACPAGASDLWFFIQTRLNLVGDACSLDASLVRDYCRRVDTHRSLLRVYRRHVFVFIAVVYW
jgi:hypothetical protein